MAAITFVFGGICFWLLFYVCGFDLAQGLKQASKTCAQSGAATGLVGAIAAWAATIGWITQRFTAASLARKQHTLNILIGMRNSELYNTHRVNVRSAFPILGPLTTSHIELLKKVYDKPSEFIFDARTGRAHYPPADSVFYVLNYLEFIAVSIMRGDLDEKMVQLPLEPTFTSSVKRYWPILKEDLEVKNFGDEPPKPNQTYAVLYNLARRWGLTVDQVNTFNAQPDAAPDVT